MLEIKEIYKEYDRKPLLQAVSFRMDAHETICLLGPSGSGKSTLLRMIAGIETPDRGDILWNGRSILHIPIHQRRFGLMFQDYALFPHLNVYANVAFGLQIQHTPREEMEGRVNEALQMVGMDAFALRQTSDLSGGEQQRVALARTIAARPQLLLLDEPLAALDRVLRKQLLTEIRQILKSTGIPAIYVTHDQEEAYLIADRVLLLGQGTILQSGTPEQVYHHPVNLAAARFLGFRNFLPGTLEKAGEPWQISTEIGKFSLDPDMKPEGFQAGEQVSVLIRGVERADHINSSNPNQFSARVLDTYFQEDHYLVRLQAGAHTFEFSMTDFPVGLDQVELVVPMENIQIFKSES